MSLRRLRAGELAAIAGAVVLTLALFLDWFAGGGAQRWRADGWSSLDAFELAVVVLALATTLWLAWATASARLVSVSVAIGVATVVAATATLAVLLLEVLDASPDVRARRADDVVDVLAGGWLGLAAGALLAAGAWWSLRDERTDAAEIVVPTPTPRSAPPA